MKSKQKIEEIFASNLTTNTGLSRLKQQGYSRKEQQIYLKALATYDDNLMRSLPCRCCEDFVCVRCSLLKLKAEYGTLDL